MTTPLVTSRLVLIPATAKALRAELLSPATLARVLDAEVPPAWPPELYDTDAVRWAIGALESGRFEPEWGFHYIAERDGTDSARPRLVGAGGYKGPPKETGSVEIGYSVLPEFRRRGFAREAVEGWVNHAFTDSRVRRVIAHTLPDLTPSIRVLESAGFSFVGPGADANEPTAIQYELRRETYDARRVSRDTISDLGA